jgi:hypothetical protein
MLFFACVAQGAIRAPCGDSLVGSDIGTVSDRLGDRLEHIDVGAAPSGAGDDESSHTASDAAKRPVATDRDGSRKRPSAGRLQSTVADRPSLCDNGVFGASITVVTMSSECDRPTP